MVALTAYAVNVVAKHPAFTVRCVVQRYIVSACTVAIWPHALIANEQNAARIASGEQHPAHAHGVVLVGNCVCGTTPITTPERVRHGRVRHVVTVYDLIRVVGIPVP